MVQKICVVGRVNEMKFQKAKSAAQGLAEFHAEHVEADITEMVPAEWDVFRENKTRELGGVQLTKDHKSSPLVWSVAEDGKTTYIGDAAAFLTWANDNFGYVDTTSDAIYNMRGRKDYNQYKRDSGRPLVYIKLAGGDVTKANSGVLDRIVIELFNDIAPLTCENFRCLCTGERGDGLHYQGVPLHRVVKGGWIQGGDIDAPHAGDGGRSVYGGLFADEGFSVPCDQPGLVGMANHGESHTNGSQFFITQTALPSWDSKYVVFGRVIEGMRTLKVVDQMQTENDRPINELVISDCGMAN